MYNRMSDTNDGEKPVLNEPQQPPEYTSQPLTGYPTQQPQGGYPPPQPQGGYPTQQPQGGYLPQQSQGGYPPPQPQGGYPPQPMYPTSHQSSSTNTTVVIQQPQPQLVIQGPRDWSTGLCSCFDDCGVCCLAFFCPCALQCMLSSNAGECCCVAAACPIALRTKIRTRHNIHGSIFDDCCILACCPLCALCQMAREVNLHGI